MAASASARSDLQLSFACLLHLRSSRGSCSTDCCDAARYSVVAFTPLNFVATSRAKEHKAVGANRALTAPDACIQAGRSLWPLSHESDMPQARR